MNIKAYVDVDVSEYAKQVHAPTLVLPGANDRIVPLALGEDLARTIRGANLEVVAGASHTLVHRHAETRSKTISFILEVEGRQPHNS
jgi:pimeloyl-ACP methyl ester carboxylesterase